MKKRTCMRCGTKTEAVLCDSCKEEILHTYKEWITEKSHHKMSSCIVCGSGMGTSRSMHTCGKACSDALTYAVKEYRKERNRAAKSAASSYLPLKGQKNNNKTLDRLAMEAKKRGISYGKLVAELRGLR